MSHFDPKFKHFRNAERYCERTTDHDDKFGSFRDYVLSSNTSVFLQFIFLFITCVICTLVSGTYVISSFVVWSICAIQIIYMTFTLLALLFRCIRSLFCRVRSQLFSLFSLQNNFVIQFVCHPNIKHIQRPLHTIPSKTLVTYLIKLLLCHRDMLELMRTTIMFQNLGMPKVYTTS